MSEDIPEKTNEKDVKLSCFASLLNKFDAFGWIPTIRGALSLDLIGNSDNLWGDVDKHSVAILNYSKMHAERFVAATSLVNVSDSKYGNNYIRNFRYFFYGSIHCENDENRFLKDNNLEGNVSLRDMICNEGMLIGSLVIILEDSSKISDIEIRIIKEIKELCDGQNEYVRDFQISALSLNDLETKRMEMKSQWDNIRNDISNLGGPDKIIYRFQVFLTRDGILLLKNDTPKEFRDSFCEKNTAEDYTLHVPLHRLFKTSMNFIKFLFHRNYHHNETHDTFLPASNLHPFQKTGDFSRVFKHQIDAFLQPVILHKRTGFRHYDLDPVGIFNYAKSFVYTCRNRNLISKDDASRQLEYITIQEAEAVHITRNHRTLLNSIAAQRNIFFILSTILAFTVAVIKIYESGFRIMGGQEKLNSSENPYVWLFIVGTAVIGYVIFEISHYQALKKEFHRSKFYSLKRYLKHFCFYRDSDLINGQLSNSMRFYIKFQEIWYRVFSGRQMYNVLGGRVATQIFTILSIWGFICLAIYLIIVIISDIISGYPGN